MRTTVVVLGLLVAGLAGAQDRPALSVPPLARRPVAPRPEGAPHVPAPPVASAGELLCRSRAGDDCTCTGLPVGPTGVDMRQLNRRVIARMRRCIDNGGRIRSGRVRLVVTLRPSGRVSSVRIAESTTDPSVAACLASAVRALEMPRFSAAEGDATVELPIVIAGPPESDAGVDAGG